MKQYISRSPDETREIGFTLGKLLKPGDIVGLYGELGTGKTTLVQGIARAFGIDERDIASASFTIIAEYNAVTPIVHIDLYRIEGARALTETGFWDHIGEDTVSVIEWPEKAEKWLSGDMIKVRLKALDEHMREITIEERYEKNRNNL